MKIRSAFRTIALLLCLATFATGAQSDNLLFKLAREESVEPEIKRAAQRMLVKLITSEYGVVEDVELSGYLSGLLERLEPSNHYYIGIVDRNDINAFATLGGVIMINSGLWLSSDSEEELAGVIAHELAHQNLRHIERGAEQSERDTFLGIAAIAASLLIGDQRLQEALALSSPAAMASSQLSHSREFENEADSIGFDLLRKAGIAPQGFVAFLSKIQEYEASGELPEYLRTHPVSTNRIAMLTNRIANRSAAIATVPGDELDFLLLKQKISILTKEDRDSLENREQRIGQTSLVAFPKKKMADLYGLLVAATRDKDWDAFRKAEHIIQASGIKHPFLYSALARGMRDSGRKDGARKIVQEAVTELPDSYSLAVLQSELLAETPDESGLAVIRRHQERFGERPELVRAEAELLGGVGRMAAHHLRLADLSLSEGDVQGAHKQIRIAKRINSESDAPSPPELTLKVSDAESKYKRYKEKLEEIFL